MSRCSQHSLKVLCGGKKRSVFFKVTIHFLKNITVLIYFTGIINLETPSKTNGEHGSCMRPERRQELRKLEGYAQSKSHVRKQNPFIRLADLKAVGLLFSHLNCPWTRRWQGYALKQSNRTF